MGSNLPSQIYTILMSSVIASLHSRTYGSVTNKHTFNATGTRESSEYFREREKHLLQEAWAVA